MPKAYKEVIRLRFSWESSSDHAALWQVFSQVAKQQETIPLNGSRNDAKAVYSFHESLVNALRPILKEGVRSVVVASTK